MTNQPPTATSNPAGYRYLITTPAALYGVVWPVHRKRRRWLRRRR